MKKIVCLLGMIILLVAMGSAVYAEDGPIKKVSVNPYGGEISDIDVVSWEELSNGYYLFLPSDTDPAKARIWVSSSGYVSLDGKPLTSGQTAEGLTPGKHILSCEDSSIELNVCYSANIPSVHIQTESKTLIRIHGNKEYKEKAIIRVYENGEMTLDKDLKQIKGRGNATWDCPKKPYNIKFDKKTDMFGMGAAKKWTLLANYMDESLVRNSYGWEYAEALGMPFTSKYKHVDLYINEQYLGNYVICESVEVGKERVNIHNLEDDNEEANPDVDLESLGNRGNPAGFVNGSSKWIDIPASPDDITGGYLLEYEVQYRYLNESSGFITDNGQHVILKEPELASESEVKYIQGFVNDMTNALYSETGYNSKGKHYSEYMDVDSLVNMYIVQELSANLDAGITSFFAYKDRGSDKLVFSPIWDLDHSFGGSSTRGAINSADPNTWWANSIGYDKIHFAGVDVTKPFPTVMAAAYRHKEFRDAVSRRWTALLKDDAFKNVRSDVHKLNEDLRASAKMNIIRWNDGANESYAARSYSDKVKSGENFIDRRCVALTKGFADNSAMLYYDPNGGIGCIFNPYIASIGDSVKIISNAADELGIDPPKSRYRFAGWNTKADGSGKTLQPGDSLTLTKGTTVLYAVWKTKKQSDDPGDPGNPMVYGDLKEFSTFAQGELLNDSFYFNKNWFAGKDIDGRNDELALLSMQIAATAAENDPDRRCADILNKLGFDGVTSTSPADEEEGPGLTYGICKTGSDVIAAIVVHSINLDDAAQGAEENIEGQKRAAEQFDVAGLVKKMKDLGGSGCRLKFWVMGHGRGGAAAYLLAHRLKNDAVKPEVFGYTFEAPAVVDTDIAAASDDSYIHDYVCGEDQAASAGGKARYGTTHDLLQILSSRVITNTTVNQILRKLGSGALIDESGDGADLLHYVDTEIARLKALSPDKTEKCKITFVSNDPDQNPDSVTANTGDLLRCMDLPVLNDRTKLQFDGWFDESGVPAEQLTAAGMITLYGKWKEVSEETDEPEKDPEKEQEIGLNITKSSLKAGKTLTLKSKDGTVISWRSSNKKIAIVKKGKVIALAKGSTVITATLEDGRTQTCSIKVTSSPKLSKKSVTVKKGKTVTVKIVGKAPGVNNKYKNTKKAKIVSKKTAKTIKVKGLKKGKTTLKIKVGSTWLKVKVSVK